MKTTVRTIVLAAFASGLLLGALGSASAAPPFPTPPKGGLPACKADLLSCDMELRACQEELAACEKLDVAPVPATGQTRCSDAAGYPIDCAGTGQDGQFKAGVVAPDPRFDDRLDGTVLDRLTGLLWLKEVNCQELRSTPTLEGSFWEDALSSAKHLDSGHCGLTDGSEVGDWRLPNVRELMSLVDYGFHEIDDPAIAKGHPFKALRPTQYWTSTSVRWYVGGSIGYLFPSAFVVTFNIGNIESLEKNGLNAGIWPVRNP